MAYYDKALTALGIGGIAGAGVGVVILGGVLLILCLPSLVIAGAMIVAVAAPVVVLGAVGIAIGGIAYGSYKLTKAAYKQLKKCLRDNESTHSFRLHKPHFFDRGLKVSDRNFETVDLNEIRNKLDMSDIEQSFNEAYPQFSQNANANVQVQVVNLDNAPWVKKKSTTAKLAGCMGFMHKKKDKAPKMESVPSAKI